MRARRLGVHGAYAARPARPALPWLFRAPFGPALELLSTSSTLHDPDVMAAWLAEIADWPPSLRTFELTESESGRLEPPGFVVVFERDARGELALVTIRLRFDPPAPLLDGFLFMLAAILEAFPPNRVVRLAVDFPSAGVVPPDRVADLRRIVDRSFKLLEEVRWPAGFG